MAQQQGFLPGLLGGIKQRGQTFITRLGGISPTDQATATEEQLKEARLKGRKELAARLSDALLGQDIGAGVAQRQQRQLAMMQVAEEQKRKKIAQEAYIEP